MSAPAHAQHPQSAYCTELDDRLRVRHAAGDTTFAALLASALGADPRLVADRATALGLDVDYALVPQAFRAFAPQLHPYWCEWYFTRPCAARLAARFGPDLLCLGTPTVAAECGALVLDRDPQLLIERLAPQPLRARACDLALATTLALPHPVSAVLADPPWYGEAPRRWFALAARAVQPEGHVAMVLPPRLQRPTAAAERAAMIAFAETLGPSRLEAGVVAYDTPQFERAAMQAAGLGVPAAWRTADLLVTQVERPHAVVVPEPAPAELCGVETFRVGDQLITLRGPRPQYEGERAARPPLAPVDGIHNFVWSSISRRDPRWASIDLWTSRNRVAQVHDHAAVREALSALQTGDLPVGKDEPYPTLAQCLQLGARDS